MFDEVQNKNHKFIYFMIATRWMNTTTYHTVRQSLSEGDYAEEFWITQLNGSMTIIISACK
jgi:hypothetical protein